MHHPTLTLATAMLFTTAATAAASPRTVASPDGRNVVTIDADKLTYAVSRDSKTIIDPSPLGLNLDIGAPDRYNQAALSFQAADKKLRFDVLVRAYDNGVALRYAVPRQPGVGALRVMSRATHGTWAR